MDVMGENEKYIKIWLENLKVRDLLGDLGKVLQWTLGMDLIPLAQVVSCELGNRYHRSREFLDQLSDCQPVKEYSAPWSELFRFI
jgi:hypothetical protein